MFFVFEIMCLFLDNLDVVVVCDMYYCILWCCWLFGEFFISEFSECEVKCFCLLVVNFVFV